MSQARCWGPWPGCGCPSGAASSSFSSSSSFTRQCEGHSSRVPLTVAEIAPVNLEPKQLSCVQLKRSQVLAPGSVCWQLKPWQWGCWVWHGVAWHGMAWLPVAMGEQMCLGGVGTQVIDVVEVLQGPGRRHRSYRDILMPVLSSLG